MNINKFTHQNRTAGALKRKFVSLHRNKMPKRHLLMPLDVQHAIHIRQKISDRVDLAGGEDATAEVFLNDDDVDIDLACSPSSEIGTVEERSGA